MENTMLVLKKGVKLTEQDGRAGLAFAENTIFAKDKRQEIIIRALIEQAQPLDKLIAMTRTCDGQMLSDVDASLALAEFILDFGDYLFT